MYGACDGFRHAHDISMTSLLGRISPAMIEPLVGKLHEVALAATSLATSHATSARTEVNRQLAGLEPVHVIVGTLLAALVLTQVAELVAGVRAGIKDAGGGEEGDV